jgi:hypothetical protein
MQMQQRDWYEYLSYLRGQIQGVDLKNPKTIAESLNSYSVKQDIEDVVNNKLKKTVRREKKPIQTQD